MYQSAVACLKRRIIVTFGNRIYIGDTFQALFMGIVEMDQ